MKILLDNNMPVQIRKLLPGHLVLTCRSMGWTLLENGNLIKAAEAAGFDVMLTGDQNIWYQQNNLDRKLALVVLSRIDRPGVEANVNLIQAALRSSVPGSFTEVKLPRRPRPQR